MKRKVLALFMSVLLCLSLLPAIAFAADSYDSQLMRDLLADDDDSIYEIREFPVDLFDYDPNQLNAVLKAAASDGNGFYPGYGSPFL